MSLGCQAESDCGKAEEQGGKTIPEDAHTVLRGAALRESVSIQGTS